MNSLPKGVRVTQGWVQVRIMRHGQVYTKNFGTDSPLARELASIHASEKYKEFLMSRGGIKKEALALKFKVARSIFYKRHYEDYRDEVTNLPRTEGSKSTAQGCLAVLGRTFDNDNLHDIRVVDVKDFRTQRLEKDKVATATFNREKGTLSALFNQFKAWVASEEINPVKLPEENPCDFIPKMQENERERVPDTWELAAAYQWCQENDKGLWDAIENGLLTALRKGDLVALDGSLTVKGLQQKTGEKFDLPITLERPTGLKNYKKRWNALRCALGWMPTPKGQPKNPKHTTWHDLRHFAPTMLGEQGFSTKIIQNYLGHSQEKTTERYVNVRRKSLEPAVKTVKEAIEKIKESQPE